MPASTINYLTEIRFGAGAVRELSDVLQKMGVRRPLLVTDAGLMQLGIVDRLALQPPAIFSAVPTNPTEESVLAGLAAFRESGCDGVLAVGGGSPIDCGKAIALLTTHPPPLEQYALIRGGLTKVTAKKPPLVAVPTTAGTGSEVGRGALISFSRGCKLAIISPHLIPAVAICDPELTLDLPPRLTAATGMDAISHCVETFCSPKFNPVADAIAVDGLARAICALPGAVRDGRNLHLRSEMMMASLQGGLTFQKGLGLIHSLSHPLGALPDKPLHHGTLNAILLPHVLRFNASACPEKFERLAGIMNVAGPEAVADRFAGLISDIGLPSRLSELRVTYADLDGIPEAALADHSTPTNPRSFTVEDCRSVLQAAL